MENNYFVENYKTEVSSDQVLKNGKFKYVSWANCQKRLKELDPKATWKMCEKENGDLIWNGFVKLELTFLGQTETTFYPILDSNNTGVVKREGTWFFRSQYKDKSKTTGEQKAIGYEVTGMDINNAQMRGFAKLFAMVTGYSLSIYTGEDLIQYAPVEETRERDKIIKEQEKETGITIKGVQLEIKRISDNIAKAKGNKMSDVFKFYGITGAEDIKKLLEIKELMLNELLELESTNNVN